MTVFKADEAAANIATASQTPLPQRPSRISATARLQAAFRARLYRAEGFMLAAAVTAAVLLGEAR